MTRKINVKYVVRDLSANLIKNNDVMPIGVISYETDTNKVKLSDGEKSYNNLPYVSSDSSSLNMDYSQLLGKPQINSVELIGNKSLDDLGIAAKNAVYTKEEVDAKVTSVYKFKGSVANEASLPSEGNVIGDVYNVEDTGANFAWDGTKWDNLGMSVDLTPYLTKEAAETTYATKVELGNKADKATTVAGYGIADAYTKGEVDSALANKADKSTTYTKDEVDGKLANKADTSALEAKADKATTLNGYGIADAYTKGEVDSALVNKANESDVIEQDSSIISLLSRLDLLESRLSNLSKQNEEIVENNPSEAISLDEEKDYVVSGNRESNMTIANALSIDYSNSTVSNNACIKLNSTNETSLNNIKYSGNFDKSTGNTVTSIQNSKYVNIKNCEMLSNSQCYNAIEIGLNGEVLAKSILIDNCVFDGSCSNNAISFFGTENNAVININNCEFNNVSNVLRLSNRTNANNITINITNCKCNSWVTSPIEYTGMILCQDYTSTSASAVKENNLFAPSKITINICNFILPNGQKLSMPENMSDICGSKNDNQILYVYADKEGYVDYDSSRYPTVNII